MIQPRKMPGRGDFGKKVKPGTKASPESRPHPPPGKKHEPKKATEKQIFIWAEGQQESGGNYDAVNSSSGALGRWQVMPANLPGWLAQSGLPNMTASQYLHSPKAQDRLAWVILGGDFDRYGARGAASVWYSGQPDWHATYGNPPVYQYVDDVIAIMRKAGGTIPPGGSTGASAPGVPNSGNVGLPPKPGKEDWSPHIIRTRNSLHDTSKIIEQHQKHLSDLRIEARGI